MANKVIAVSGLIGSGKDSVADYLIANHNFRKESFASSLKDSVAAVFGWDREMLEGSTTESRIWRDQVDHWWANRLGMAGLTPRWVLQQCGTEVWREHFHNDIWVASLEYKLMHTNDNIVITDCRFINEINVVKKVNGITIRVERGQRPTWYDDAANFNLKGPGWEASKQLLDDQHVHASEYSNCGLNFDHQVDNNGSFEDLYQLIEAIIT